MNVTVFWDVRKCRVVEIERRWDTLQLLSLVFPARMKEVCLMSVYS